jgi:hypothetical protein
VNFIFRRLENFKTGFIQKDAFSTELWFLLLFMAVPRKFTFSRKDVIHVGSLEFQRTLLDGQTDTHHCEKPKDMDSAVNGGCGLCSGIGDSVSRSVAVRHGLALRHMIGI